MQEGNTNRLGVLLWYLFWPLSEVFGRPAEADEPLPRPICWLLAILGTGLLCTVIVFILGIRCGWWQ